MNRYGQDPDVFEWLGWEDDKKLNYLKTPPLVVFKKWLVHPEEIVGGYYVTLPSTKVSKHYTGECYASIPELFMIQISRGKLQLENMKDAYRDLSIWRERAGEGTFDSEWATHNLHKLGARNHVLCGVSSTPDAMLKCLQAWNQ